MILQGIYRFVSQDFAKAYFEDEDGRYTSILLSDWHEMGRPEQVSVTVMKLLVRT